MCSEGRSSIRSSGGRRREGWGPCTSRWRGGHRRERQRRRLQRVGATTRRGGGWLRREKAGRDAHREGAGALWSDDTAPPGAARCCSGAGGLCGVAVAFRTERAGNNGSSTSRGACVWRVQRHMTKAGRRPAAGGGGRDYRRGCNRGDEATAGGAAAARGVAAVAVPKLTGGWDRFGGGRRLLLGALRHHGMVIIRSVHPATTYSAEGEDSLTCSCDPSKHRRASPATFLELLLAPLASNTELHTPALHLPIVLGPSSPASDRRDAGRSYGVGSQHNASLG